VIVAPDTRRAARRRTLKVIATRVVDGNGRIGHRSGKVRLLMRNTVIWRGRSGAAYSFIAHPLEEALDDRSGVYVFAKRNAAGDAWKAIYIGEADSFSRELAVHPKRQCARNHAATHLHVLTEVDEEARRSAVRDLIALWHPPCNQTLADAICPTEHASAAC
jgi:hypothetical protein